MTYSNLKNILLIQEDQIILNSFLSSEGKDYCVFSKKMQINNDCENAIINLINSASSFLSNKIAYLTAINFTIENKKQYNEILIKTLIENNVKLLKISNFDEILNKVEENFCFFSSEASFAHITKLNSKNKKIDLTTEFLNIKQNISNKFNIDINFLNNILTFINKNNYDQYNYDVALVFEEQFKHYKFLNACEIISTFKNDVKDLIGNIILQEQISKIQIVSDFTFLNEKSDVSSIGSVTESLLHIIAINQTLEDRTNIIISNELEIKDIDFIDVNDNIMYEYGYEGN